MKTTGIIRRIDELGRIVIPKEIRKQLKLHEGESIVFSLDEQNIILTKYSLFHHISDTILILLDELYRRYGNTVLVYDQNHCVLCSYNAIEKFQKQELSEEMKCIIERQEACIEHEMNVLYHKEKVTIYPITYNSELLGAFVILTQETPYYMMDNVLIEFIIKIIKQEMSTCG